MTEPLPFHPLADIFPLMEGAEFEDLVADIRAKGLLEPITRYQGKCLDGRNRCRACVAANVQLRVEDYTGNDPVGFVISRNLRRRHLSESQRAMVAAKLSTLGHGQRQSGKFAGVPTQGEAATLLNVSERSVRTATEVRDQGAPELVRAVERGNVSISAAADVAKLPLGEQQEVVARGEREILQVAKAIRAERAKARRAERIRKLVEISRGNATLPTLRRYPVVYADPAYQYEIPERLGLARSVEEHYPTMTLDDICALPVTELATDDALLFLWSPAPLIEKAMQVIAAWGFEYRTCAVWVKDKIGMGLYVRQQHELLLIARRGEPPLPAEADRLSSVIIAPRGEHSAKPVAFYERIERMYPDLPKIELFARNARCGWDAWGNEIKSQEAAS
jgi:N6-adenosine-specific RNA methylase IME4